MRNTVESLNLLAAVGFKNKIVVFGGHYTHTYNSLILSKDGELEEDLSHAPFIPGCLYRGSSTVEIRKIYAMGFNRLDEKFEWKMKVFDGKKWSAI